ncbi:serine hydrolase domain-containing protein [Nonomuraea sp. NPDC049421]|uniref:serine hydrolase domain-containing protein n=1 Tax=Nonomuraea sp. NPDC049421 TaxID=3155275 RepID=UPI003424476E
MSLRSLVAAAGYRPDEPLMVGVTRRDAPPVLLTQGTAAAGDPVTATTLVYAASLSKQLTAACAALLVKDGVLDVDAPLSRWLPELPAWASEVRLRHLVHHTAGLPDDRDIDADCTTAGVLRALARFPSLRRRPGTAYAYSNAGYVCLAVAVERCAGRPLPAFARERLFTPLGMTRTRFWPGPSPAPDGPGSVAPVAGPAPLSLGDGGVWTTLTDLLRWGQALNADEPGIARLVQTPGPA